MLYVPNTAYIESEQFLSDLEQKLHPLGLQERERLLALKRQEHKAKELPFDGEYYAWDYNYYHEKYIQSNLDLDAQVIKEYFPVDTVVSRILGLYQDLLCIKFLEIEGSTWHPGKFYVPRSASRARLKIS